MRLELGCDSEVLSQRLSHACLSINDSEYRGHWIVESHEQRNASRVFSDDLHYIV